MGEYKAPDPWQIPLDEIDVSDGDLFLHDAFWPYFERLRQEAPVHYCKASEFGPYWSVTKFEDIKYVDTHHDIFSSETGITIRDQEEDFELPMFIAMDPPIHDYQRKVVSPAVAPSNLKTLESTIRERVCTILDSLPRDETFNWVDLV